MRFVQGPLSAVLSVSLVLASAPGWGHAAGGAGIAIAERPAHAAPMQAHDRILHALNRFTFGPRPGDVEAVQTVGLDAWFEQQLHPAAIADAALQTRLAQFPAMSWPTDVLLYRLPSNAIIRQVMNGKIVMPERGTLHTVYANQAARLEARRHAQAQPAQPMAANAMDPAMQVANRNTRPVGPDITPEQDGVNPQLVSAVLNLPPRDRVLKLMAMPQPQLDAFFHSLKGPQRSALFANMTPEYRETLGALENPERVVLEELMAERLTRDIYARAQLQEVMTDFWLNHFNVYLRKNENMPYYLASYQRDVIRSHALGKFEDLLEAVAHSPAMLIYLDNAESMGPHSRAAERAKHIPLRNPNRKAPEGINENYARELMELHTLGVNGGYTQADVIQAARVLTGWTVDQPQRGGGFQFNENRHEPGTEKVLGKKFKDHGERQGEELLHMLATRPATAQFLSREIADRFVSDDPPQALVDRMAKAYLKSDGDISTVLRTLYRSPEFWSQDAYRAKVKTPLEYAVSAVRASDADITNMQPLIGALRNMGMPLYGCIPPTGYKWDAADWVSTGALVTRMNFALALAANRLPGIKTDWTAGRTSQSDTTPESEESRLESSIVDGGVSPTTRSAVLEEFEKQRPRQAPMAVAFSEARNAPLERQDQILAGLLLGSPEFQRR